LRDARRRAWQGASRSCFGGAFGTDSDSASRSSVGRRRERARGGAARRAFACLAGLTLAAAVASCASFGVGGEPIEVNLVGLTPLPSTAFEHRLRVDLRLRNPNPHAYAIDGLRFVLEVNGQRLASGTSDATVTLPRLGEVVIPVTTTTTLLDLVNQIVAFVGQEQPHFDYRVRGRIFLAHRWGSLDFDQAGTSADLLGPRSTRTDAGAAPRAAR
jgi:LEA14-like dessication related protein